ncbi:hypothetical protein B0T17DRAFT_490513 [Bombardia bombarda]|uniref:AAA+ ATPase domain-containing protein n=1 Tax=Bombardia bombarda TaxID=252184 RepID=A0AA39XBV0_9PEZI|nr:hypothetical protein B0T17DRAFT_490513 [Bombardia bombarda]
MPPPTPPPSYISSPHALPHEPHILNLYHHNCSTPYWSQNPFPSHEPHFIATPRDPSIIHRHTYSSSHREWNSFSFTIVSPTMRAILASVLDDHPGLDLSDDNWTFTKPYAPIVHRWTELRAMQYDLTHNRTAVSRELRLKEITDMLVEFLQPLVQLWLDLGHHAHVRDEMMFEGLWVMFAPGEMVVTTFCGVEMVCRVRGIEKKIDTVDSRRGAGDRWVVSLEYIEWSGQECGYTTIHVDIEKYAGWQKVTEMKTYPLEMLDEADMEEKRKRIIRRGRKFERLRGCFLGSYEGTMISMEDCQRERKPQLRPLEEVLEDDRPTIDPADYTLSKYHREYFTPPSSPWMARKTGLGRETADSDLEEIATPPSIIRERAGVLTPLSDDQCLMASPWVVGMDMKTKLWGQFLVDKFEPAARSRKMFDSLILPDGQKQLVWKLVKGKLMCKEEGLFTCCLLSVRGNGIAVFMFGPPGVGKTSTVEAVAERCCVPLYRIDARMLSSHTTTMVECALDHALELCRLWSGLLLIEDSDGSVGLNVDEQTARNRILPIMLSKLERNRSIVFMTTSCTSGIGHALSSRVDLLLPYHDLSKAARRRMWATLIKKQVKDWRLVDNVELAKLSELDLNGREINIIGQNALLLGSRAQDKDAVVELLHMLAEQRINGRNLLTEQARRRR